jgi:hypothetical protein
MLISDATAIYLGDTPVYKAYLGEDLVWGVEYLTSQNNTTSGGFTTGTVVDKTTATASVTTSSAYLPGTNNFSANRKYWTDWGNDIFDGWGLFYLYDPAQNNYVATNFSNMEQADGVISTDQFIFNGNTYSVDYGYPVQGIFKIDISVDNKDAEFAFGFDGNLGSNGSTVNSNLSQDYTLGGKNFKLHYNYNYQGTNPSENFYTYFVPYEQSKNKATRPFTRYVYSTDSLSIHSASVKVGLTIYIAKQANVKDWIINDLQLGVV